MSYSRLGAFFLDLFTALQDRRSGQLVFTLNFCPGMNGGRSDEYRSFCCLKGKKEWKRRQEKRQKEKERERELGRARSKRSKMGKTWLETWRYVFIFSVQPRQLIAVFCTNEEFDMLSKHNIPY